ncbi:MAG TPA: ATP synthase subunit I [Pseudomonadota bacterium]|nr:ATP synthase subunit I [Pseudomonadota bacterium]
MSSDLQSPPAPTSSAPTVPATAAPHLLVIERWAVLLGAALCGTTLVWGSPRVQLGACVGAGLSILNARVLRYLGARLSGARPGAPSSQTSPSSVGLLVLLFQLKLGVLAALLYLALRLLPLQPIALVLGLSALPVAIVVRGIQYGLQAAAPAAASPYSDSYTES